MSQVLEHFSTVYQPFVTKELAKNLKKDPTGLKSIGSHYRGQIFINPNKVGGGEKGQIGQKRNNTVNFWLKK